MGAFGRAIADVGKGLMERNARRREMEDLARIKSEEERAAWDREAPKRELERQLAEARIAASKQSAANSRMSSEATRLGIIAGDVRGGERFFGQEATDEEGNTTFIPQREGITRTPDSIAADSRARESLAARTSATQASRENTAAYRADQERTRLEAERRRVNEAAVDAAIQIKSRKYRPNEYGVRDESLAEIERARKEREAAIDQQILKLSKPASLLDTAEEISFTGPEDAQDEAVLAAARATGGIVPQSVAPDATLNFIGGGGPKADANTGAGSSKENPALYSSFKEEPPSGTWVRLKSGNVVRIP